MSINKQELLQAFREVASMEFANIPRDNSQIQHIFSNDFENRMNSLIKQMSEESRMATCDLPEVDTY